MTIVISASLLSANFAKLGNDCEAVLNAGADRLHLDIMDNHYVPNLTFGPLICKALRDFGITAFMDVHLMTKPVDSLIVDFAKAGANLITFHPEASLHVDRSLQLIKDHGCQTGLTLNPATSLSYVDHVLDKLDEILIMSVNPGFGGQKFIPSSLNKIREIKKMIPPHVRVAVDGGVKTDNIKEIKRAGADVFIIGSALFGTNDYAKTIKQFREKS